nr:hypothetical protein [Nocardia coffeae]
MLGSGGRGVGAGAFFVCLDSHTRSDTFEFADAVDEPFVRGLLELPAEQQLDLLGELVAFGAQDSDFLTRERQFGSEAFRGSRVPAFGPGRPLVGVDLLGAGSVDRGADCRGVVDEPGGNSRSARDIADGDSFSLGEQVGDGGRGAIVFEDGVAAARGDEPVGALGPVNRHRWWPFCW